MTDLAVQLRVTSIRSRGKFGGAIFAGRTENGDQYIAVCNHKLIHDSSIVDKGQQWIVRGVHTLRESVTNGFRQSEMQIDAEHAEMVRPAGRNIIAWIAACEDCPGVGQVKATKLWDRFGASLVTIIEKSDLALPGVRKASGGRYIAVARSGRYPETYRCEGG
jgi:exodeoxyribonuclease V alpha subunit